LSQENVEIVRGSIEAFQRGDYASALDALDPDIEYDMTHFPDGRVYRGHAGVREAFRIWLGTWENYRQELDDVIDAGDEDVIALVSEFGRGKGSGIEIERSTAGVWTIRDRRAIRIRFYDSREAALDALDLRGSA
jgi:ketosteroid isomerase-like protein